MNEELMALLRVLVEDHEAIMHEHKYSMTTTCYFCDKQQNDPEKAEHLPKCPFLKARQALGLEVEHE